jgi:hypothetical protein
MKMKECYEIRSLDSPKIFAKSSHEKTAKDLTVLLWKRLVEDSACNRRCFTGEKGAW